MSGEEPAVPPAESEPAPALPMTTEERAQFGTELRKRLASRRDVFVVDKYMFEPQDGGPDMQARRVSDDPKYTMAYPNYGAKTISAATMRLMLDYCESAWDMDFVSYCAGIFHGRAPVPGETAFDLLPDIKTRLSADRLGFGHIYGTGK